MINKMLSSLMVALLMIISSCTGAFAGGGDDIVLTENEGFGSVTSFGPSVSGKIGLVREGVSTVYLCRSDLSKKISRVPNITVKVTGEYNKSSKCLEAKSFEIKKMPSGRPAIVGSLKSKKKEFLIKSKGFDEKESEFKFRNIPTGLKKYKNEKVIIDAVPVSGDEGFFKVVSYMKHP